MIRSDILETLSSFKEQLRLPFSVEIIVSLCWSIWSARNDSIFKNLQHSVAAYRAPFDKKLLYLSLEHKLNISHCSKKISLYMARSSCVIALVFFVSFFVS